MNMIGNTANAKTFATSIVGDGSKMRMQFRPNAFMQNRRSIFGAKNNMDQQVVQRLGHSGDYRSGLQSSASSATHTWGVAPGWYSSRRWRFAAIAGIVACVLIATSGCKSSSKIAPETEAAKTNGVVYPARPTIAPPSFKIFHQTLLAFTLVTKENATDDEIAALIWQLRDAAHTSTFDKLHISQKAVDKRDPNIGFNIYRGSKCASEKFAEKPPCGASYHAAGDYTFGSYSRKDWDDGRVLHTDGSSIELWDPNIAYTPTTH